MRIAVAVAVLATLSTTGAAGVAAQASPADVATSFLKAITEERWRDAAREMDLAAFDRYRRESIARARLEPVRQRVITVEEYMRHDPDMPRAVAEYHVRKLTERPRDPSAWLMHEYARVPTYDSLAALSVEESAARWIEAQDFRWPMRRAVEEQRNKGCPESAGLRDALPAPEYRVIGAVAVDSATAYVLHQDGTFSRPDPDVDAAMHAVQPSILTLRRRGERWRILPRVGLLRGGGVVGVFSEVDCRPAVRARPPR